MTYYARLNIPPQVKGQIYTLLATTMNGTSVGDVAQTLVPNNQAMALPVIMHLAFHGEVTVPLASAPLSLDSPISLPVAPANPLLEVRR
jgi:hypothetical protein